MVQHFIIDIWAKVMRSRYCSFVVTVVTKQLTSPAMYCVTEVEQWLMLLYWKSISDLAEDVKVSQSQCFTHQLPRMSNNQWWTDSDSERGAAACSHSSSSHMDTRSGPSASLLNTPDASDSDTSNYVVQYQADRSITNVSCCIPRLLKQHKWLWL